MQMLILMILLMMGRQADGQMSIREDAEGNIVLLLMLRNMLMLMLMLSLTVSRMVLVRVVRASLPASPLVDLDLLLMLYLPDSLESPDSPDLPY